MIFAVKSAAAVAIAAALAGTPAAAPARAAQETEPVVEARTVISRDAVRPGETFAAAVILKVRPGYHINDNAPLDEFLIPTLLSLAEDPAFEVVEVAYPKGRRAKFAYSEAELVVYEGEAVLGALLKAKADLAPGPWTLKGTLSYQACNDISCLPPKELPLEIAVPVAAGGAGADAHPEIFAQIRFKARRK